MLWLKSIHVIEKGSLLIIINETTIVQIMVFRQQGAKPLDEPMTVHFDWAIFNESQWICNQNISILFEVLSRKSVSICL